MLGISCLFYCSYLVFGLDKFLASSGIWGAVGRYRPISWLRGCIVSKLGNESQAVVMKGFEVAVVRVNLRGPSTSTAKARVSAQDDGRGQSWR
jgi:hypothetical protein